jgi:hypothetical protein
MLKMIIKVKNARSWLAKISSFTAAPKATLYYGGLVAQYDHVVVTYKPTIL